jgi:hypothetical protein
MSKDAFVIMPFSSTASGTEPQWTEIFTDVFKPAFEECGYTCDRAKPMIGNLTESIVERLRNSRIVLADVTDRNPNVFYELGVRHSLKAGTIIVAQNGQEVPSDLRGIWFLRYGIRPSEVKTFKSEIRRLVAVIEENPSKSDNAVAAFLEKENLTLSRLRQSDTVKQLTALYTELTGNVAELSVESDSAQIAEEPIPQPLNLRLLSIDSLNLLLTTLYVDLGEELLSRFYVLRHKLRLIQAGYNTASDIANSISESRSLAISVLELRDRISKGDYEEQSRISTMAWRGMPSSIVMKGPVGSGKSLPLGAVSGVKPFDRSTLECASIFSAETSWDKPERLLILNPKRSEGDDKPE